MLRLEKGSKFAYAGGNYRVVQETEKDGCMGCDLDQTWVCENIACDGQILKLISELVLWFRIVDNVVLFKVVKQDEGWNDMQEGPIRCSSCPEFTLDFTYIRGVNKKKDECTSSFDCASREEAITLLNQHLEWMAERYKMEDVATKSEGWLGYKLTL